jgi:hypothetical protein
MIGQMATAKISATLTRGMKNKSLLTIRACMGQLILQNVCFSSKNDPKKRGKKLVYLEVELDFRTLQLARNVVNGEWILGGNSVFSGWLPIHSVELQKEKI